MANQVEEGADRRHLLRVARPVELFSRVSIRGCLLAAFAGITGMTLLASAVSLVSYAQFGRMLNAITVETVPAAEASLRVARTSAEIAALAPALVAASNIDETKPVIAALSAKEAKLAATIAALKGTAAGGASIQNLATYYALALKQQLNGINASVVTRLAVSQELEKALRVLEKSHRELLESLAPLVDDAGFDVTTALVLDDGRDLKAVKSNLARISNNQFDLLQKLNVLRAESNLLLGLLTTAATAPRKEQFVPLLDSATAAIQHLNQSFDLIKGNANVASIKPKLDALISLAQAPGNIFELRERELDAGAEAQRALAENRDLVDNFTTVFDTMVARSEEDVRSATSAAASTISEARWVLVATTLGGLLIAFAVGWLYVSRHVVRRLAVLRASMLAIARGDLSGAVPQGGDDEISQMAKAVEVFKQNRIEADRLTADLFKAQRELLAKERLSTLGQVSATVAHELRNPLSAIHNTMFVLKDAVSGAGLNLERLLSRIDRNIQRCDRIITDLLDFTRVTSLNCAKLEVDSWLAGVLSEYRLPDGIALRRDFGAGGHRLSFDPERLRRVIVNLIENAAQAMTDFAARQPCIAISTRASADHYELVIEDNGPGIARDLLAKVFEPLYSTKSFGTGLGLPTVKQIVEQHGGAVELSSQLDAGTRVVVYLPNEITEKVAA